MDGYPDEIKIREFNKIVDLVKKFRISAYRISYKVKPPLDNERINTVLSSCWLSIAQRVQHQAITEFILPVFDFNNEQIRAALSQPMRSGDVWRAIDMEENLSLRNTANIFEPLYADSRFTSMIQIVDVILYLRHCNDWNILGYRLNEFKSNLLPISKRLEGDLLIEDALQLNI